MAASQHDPLPSWFPSSSSMGPQTVSSSSSSGGEGAGDNAMYNDTSLDISDSNFDIYALLIMAGGAENGIDPDVQDYMNKLTHYLMGIGGSIVCCLGTIANAMSVAVLTRPVMKSSTYMYLAALAVCDSLVLFFTLLLVLKDTKPPESPHQLDTFHAILYPFVHPTAIVFQVTSIWLTLAFTVDRYIMICHPFKAEHMCRKSRARKVVVGIYIGGLLFNIPKYLENYTKTDEFKIANSTHVYKTYGVMTTDIGNNELFRKIVHSWGYLIFVCGIPFLTLVILNAFLIRAVRESRLKGKEINPKEKHRNDTTIMLIGVIIIFLICQGPALASRMTYAFKPGTTRNKAVFTLNEVASFLVILNSAINIVPYYLFGRKFRSEFWRIFCACFLDKDEIRRIARSYSISVDQRKLSNYNVMEMNGMGPNKENNEIRASNNCVQRCGLGSTRAASFNSNLNDDTLLDLVDGDENKSNSFGDIRLNPSVRRSDDGVGGACSGTGNGQQLALPLIHNAQNSFPPSSFSRTSDHIDYITPKSKSFNDKSDNNSNKRKRGDLISPSSPSSLYNYLSLLNSNLPSNETSSTIVSSEHNDHTFRAIPSDGCGDSGKGGDGGSGCGSCSSRLHDLDPPLLHNTQCQLPPYSSNISSSSPLSSYRTADVTNSFSDFSDKFNNIDGSFSKHTSKEKCSPSPRTSLSPSSSSAPHHKHQHPSSPILSPSYPYLTATVTPSTPINNYAQPSPVMEKQKLNMMVSSTNTGNDSHHGKYMSIATNPGYGAKSTL